MKYIVAILALLAVTKLYVQDQIYRSATSDALIAAYRSNAILACQKIRSDQPAGSAQTYWANPSAITVQVGRADLGVNLWQISDPRWDAAYRQPYLVLTSADPRSPLTCTYDINVNTATVAASGST